MGGHNCQAAFKSWKISIFYVFYMEQGLCAEELLVVFGASGVYVSEAPTAPSVQESAQTGFATKMWGQCKCLY